MSDATVRESIGSSARPPFGTFDRGGSMADRADDPSTSVDDAWGELSSATDVTLNVLERYGHLDILVADTAQRDVFQPTLE